MKIAIFTWGIGPGAFANVAAALATGFDEMNLDIEIVHVHRCRPGDRVSFPNRTRVVSLNARRSLLSAPRLARYLTTQNPDVMIALGTMMNPIAVMAKSMARWRGILLLNEASSMSYKAWVEHRRDMRFRWMPRVARWLYPKADGIVAPSADIVRDLREKIGLRSDMFALRIIPNPVDVAFIRKRAREEPARPDLIPDSEPLVIGVGRLARQKNYPLLIRSFAKVRQRLPARLLLLGEGPERKHLESIVAELHLDNDVFLAGVVRNPFPYMVRASAFALSSEEEGFGLVLVEALACGCPIVATRCPGGPREILENGRVGILIPTHDEDAMANALLSLLEDDEKADRLRKLGLERSEQFAPYPIALEWRRLIDEVQDLRRARGA